ncbi:MAG: aminotransferase class V-fold PLP-dependent enzyme [Paracoccaceae bacterium]
MTCDSYLYYHSIGQYPGKEKDLAEAMAGFAQLWAACDNDQWARMLEGRAEYLALWAGLIDADPAQVTAVENVTAGLHAVLTALPERQLRGRTLLVAADCFPSLHFLLTGLAPRLGFTLRTVPLRPGETWVSDEQVLEMWDESVGVALLTQVTSTSSHACDLERLMAHGRAMGSLMGVDITQAAGLLPFSARETEADFAMSTSLKWVCGTPGAGMLYVAPHITGTAAPELRGWFSQPDPFNWDINAFSYAADARRFDHGTPAMMGALASLPALRWHARQDRAALLAHTRMLCRALIEVMDRHGLPLASPREEARRGGSVMARLPDRFDPGATVAALREAEVICDNRSAVLRFSPGVVTTEAGVARLDAALEEILTPAKSGAPGS